MLKCSKAGEPNHFCEEPETVQQQLEAVVWSALHIATWFKSHFSPHSFLSFTYSLVHSPPPPSLLSEWPAPALRRMCCSRWPAVAARPASPWRRPVSASGRSPWTVARRPCKSGRTNRAGAPWAERRRGYSARAPTGAPGGRESTRTCIQKDTHGILKTRVQSLAPGSREAEITLPSRARTAEREKTEMERQTYLP